jgi:hypothetical protein
MTTTNGDCVSLMQGTLVRPVARYPSSIATDPSLKVAANRVQTTLRGSISTGDTLITVSDASRLVPEMLLSADSEILSISSISGNNLTVVRGFDGTQPACHSSGTTMRVEVDAWHHNALAAEITAIEQTLGPNLSNITGAVSSGLVSTLYAWQQQGSGNLSPGANVITLTPVPRGVSGTNVEHWVYISNGTGAAEACLITGGTAVSGAASGTIIVTCANAHSGAWTVGTATAGIQEALWVGLSYSAVFVPAGIHQLYATVWVNDHQTLFGAGRGATQLYFNTQNRDGIMVGRGPAIGSITIRDLFIGGRISSTASGYALRLRNCSLTLLANIHFQGFWSGLHITEGSSFCNVTQCHFDGLGGASIATAMGINIDSGVAGIYMNSLELIGYASGPQYRAGIRVRYIGTVEICTADILHCGSGLMFDPGAGQLIIWCFFTNVTCDAGDLHGIEIAPTNGGDICGLNFTGCWSSSNSRKGVYANKGTGGRLTGLSFVNHMAVANREEGFALIGAKDVTISASAVTESGSPPTATNTQPGLYASNCAGLSVTGSRLGAAFQSPTGNTQNWGMVIDTGNTDFIVEGNNLRGNLSGALQNLSASTSNIVRNNLGIDEPGAALASTSALTLTNSVHHVTGTASIDFVGGPGAAGGAVRLIADGAWRLTAAGNIGAAITMTPGTSITLWYDLPTARWYPNN